MKRWLVKPPWSGRNEAVASWKVAPLVAQIIHNRGIEDAEAARSFLEPRLSALHPPELLPGAVEAAQRIADAARSKKRIVLYGDYDVDGITSVAILWEILKPTGANVDFYVPHRIEEGYGLNSEALTRLAADGAELVVSVDCGITARAAAEAAKDAGLELIITDHHTPHEELPDAAVIVHPTVGGHYPNEFLSGAGVAFKLAWAIAQNIVGQKKVGDEYRRILLNTMSLAALGTIADVVPLIGENRVIARYGLKGLADCDLPGMQELIDCTGLRGAKIDGYDVGFKLAPRLNAAGRMGHARLAVELLTRADAQRAKEIALYLEEQNRTRRTVQRRIFKAACSMVEAGNLAGDANRALVLAGEDWHAGVIGIVAARLVETYGRPTVLISVQNGTGQGSARSIAPFNMNEAFEYCSGHLEEFGGHAMAGGLRIAGDRIEEFAREFVEHANNVLTAADLESRLDLDAQVRLNELDEASVRAILDLGPFGPCNPKPMLCTDWLNLSGEPRTVGKTGDHLQFSVEEDGLIRKVIAFGQADRLQDLKDYRKCRIAFEPLLNEWNGRRSVEMQAIDIKFPDDDA